LATLPIYFNKNKQIIYDCLPKKYYFCKMKKILVFLIFFPFVSKGQSCDLIYLPKSQNLVASYNFNNIPVGMYVGGYIKTSFPSPFIYTTPISYLNRIGISITNRKMDFMFGGFIESYRDSIKITPDFWLKIHTLKIITNTANGFDFVIALNYMKKTNLGIGISIPLGNIY